MSAPSVEVREATAGERDVVANLLELYVHDFSEMQEIYVGDDGRFGYDRLDDYWERDDSHPFLLRVDGRLAGFALVQRGSVLGSGDDVWDMEEFFVMRRYRRGGFGTKLARSVWERLPGRWEVRVAESNPGALRFWLHAAAEQVGREVPAERVRVHGRSSDVLRFEA